MAKAPFPEVLECSSADAGIIGEKAMYFHPGRNVPQKYDGYVQPLENSTQSRGLDAGDDAIALPVLEPAREVIAQTVFLDKNRPVGILANVFGNTRKCGAPIRTRGLDEQSNTWPFIF